MKYSLLAGLLCSGIVGFAQKPGKKVTAAVLPKASSGVYAVAASTASSAASSDDITYLSSSDFSGTGTASDPIRIKASAIQTWLQSLPGYTADGSKYLASDFTWKTVSTSSGGGGGATTISAGTVLFDVASAYQVQQHPDGPGAYYSSQGNGIAQATRKIAAGSDGLVYFQYLAGTGELLSLGYTTVNSLQGYEHWTGGLIVNGTEVKAYGYNASTVGLGVAPVNNRYYGFRRNGSTIEIVTSNEGAAWTVLGYTNYSSDDLYIQVYFQTPTAKIKALGQNLVSY